MQRLLEIKVGQLDGSVKVYNEYPWWLGMPMQKQDYRVPSKKVTKADKISATMTKIAQLNRETLRDSLLTKGIVRRKNETGKITIREVLGKVQ